MVGREGLDEAADTGHGAGVAQVGAEEVAVLDQDGRRRRPRQLGGAAVRPQLIVNLVRVKNKCQCKKNSTRVLLGNLIVWPFWVNKVRLVSNA